MSSSRRRAPESAHDAFHMARSGVEPAGRDGYLRCLTRGLSHLPLRGAAALIPEVRALFPLLQRARHGIEFFGLSGLAEARLTRICHTDGLERLAEFLMLLAELADCTDYRLLSIIPAQAPDLAVEPAQAIQRYVEEHCSRPLSIAEVSRAMHMGERQFTRHFRETMGTSFIDHVNRVRVGRACEMLMQTDKLVSSICFEAGFNNVANFNRRFMEVKHMTPSAYRIAMDGRFGGVPD